MDWPTQRPGTTADVALLLEGTYPYVSGGVSGWVHQLIRAMPERTFSLIFLGAQPGHYGPPRYEPPPNVVHLEHHWLAQAASQRRQDATPCAPEAVRANLALHASLSSGRSPEAGVMQRVASALGAAEGLSEAAFLHGEESWEQLCHVHEQTGGGSFIDAFWTARTMHRPLFTLARATGAMPPARILHAVSTGYAGLLGALLSSRRGLPLLLSEHGIYTKERRIDLAMAEWISDDGPGGERLRRSWSRFFEGLGRLAYDAAFRVTSLYEGNRRRQLADGAEASRTRVVPNGIDVTRFAALREKRAACVPHVVGLIGRVVPIKDIRTFVRAMRVVCDQLPNAEGWIVGPEEEDVAYARECRALVMALGLEGRVRFLGLRRVDEILPQLGVLTLTSISEALPLVVLEALASGLPVVTTDVGACREIVEGRSDDDDHAGLMTCIASPDETAKAILALLTDERRWKQAQAAGIARVERSYAEERMVASYRSLYDEADSWRA